MVNQRAKQRSEIELIEVLAPDDPALWAEAASLPTPADGADDRRPPRRGLVLAALAVAGVIVVAIALDDSSTSQTTATTSTVDGPSTTVRSSLGPDRDTTPHYLVDDPTLKPYSADIVTPTPDSELLLGWTSASPLGPLIMVQLHGHAYQPYGILDATRRVVDGFELVSPTDRATTVIVEVETDGGRSATIQTTGVADSDVVQIASTFIPLPNGGLSFDPDVLERLGLILGFKASSVEEMVYGTVESSARYLLADGRTVTLRSAPSDGGGRDNFLTLFAGDLLQSYMGDVVSPRLDRVAGRLLDGGDSIVVWRDGENRLSLVGPVDVTDLMEISLNVRRATDAEWSDMLYGLRPDFRVGDFATLATGHASNTELWRAGPQIAQRAGRTEFLWWWTVPGLDDVTASAAASLAVTHWSHVDRLVVPGATFVFVTHPNSGGTITVRTANGVEYVAELMQPFPRQSPVFMTVIRIEEPGPLIVERDGIVLGQCEHAIDC